MRVGSLFSGIGGLELGFERAGMEVIWQVENDRYATRVLEKHWPNVRRWNDVRTFEGWPADLVCGGFPCQPVSVAGQKKAQEDARWMWPEFARIIRAVRPRYVVVENVPGLLSRGFGDVLGDLAASGYDAEWFVLAASDFGAPHLRKRVFVVAYADDSRPSCTGQGDERKGEKPVFVDASSKDVVYATVNGWDERRAGDAAEVEGRWELDRSGFGGFVAYPDRHAADWFTESWSECHNWQSEPDVGRVANGVPSRVDRLKCLGNAVVPQVAEWIGRRIMRHEVGTK